MKKLSFILAISWSVPLWATSPLSPELQELQNKMQSLRHRLSAYQRCTRGKCSAEEKQIILKAAAKDGMRLGLGIIIAASIGGLWKWKTNSKFKYTFLDFGEKLTSVSYRWNHARIKVSTVDIKNMISHLRYLLQDVQSENFSMYLSNARGEDIIEIEVNKVRTDQIITIHILKSSSLDQTALEYIQDIQNKSLSIIPDDHPWVIVLGLL